LLYYSQRTPTPAIDTLSLHDALPISSCWSAEPVPARRISPLQLLAPAFVTVHVAASSMSSIWSTSSRPKADPDARDAWPNISVADRKSTRLNSSHLVISYAVFCLKKK